MVFNRGRAQPGDSGSGGVRGQMATGPLSSTMKRLYRSQTDKKIAGICGGLGEMFSIDSALVRLAVVFITATLIIINGAVVGILPVVVAYLVGWVIVPVSPTQEDNKDEEFSMRRIYRSHKDKKIAGICGGLGEMLSIDSTLIRLAVVFVGLATGVVPLLFVYLIGWLIIPTVPLQEDRNDAAESTDIP